MNRETKYLAWFSLSLAFIMGATLFVLVGVNPKLSAYEALPWIYAVACIALAAITGTIARRVGQKLQLSEAKVRSNDAR